MKQMLVALTAVAALALAGCSSKTFCEDQDEVFKELLASKLADCPNLKDTVSVSSPPAGEACEDAYAKCTENDKEKLEETMECERALEACTPETENTTWLPSVMGCMAKMCTASNPCLVAFKMDQVCQLMK